MRTWITFVSFLFIASVSATVNEPFRWDFFSGYRNDRLHWHMQHGGSGTLLYSELYRDLSFWENGLAVQTISHDLVFFLYGSYGAFGSGNLKQRYADLFFTLENPQFYFSPEGWAADTFGYFGYAVNLTTDRTYKVLLIPLFGFSGHFERLARGNGTPSPLESTDAIGASSYAMTSSLPNHLHSTWYGFFLGANFQIEPGGSLNFKGGYSYHWLNVRLRTDYEAEVSLLNPALFSEQQTDSSFYAKGDTNGGQTGWAQMDYLISKAWRAGIGARMRYYSSNLIETSVKQTITSIVPSGALSSSSAPQKIKIRWVSVSGWLMISRDF